MLQQANNDAGLDEYQVHTWRAWHAHITLAMLAHAWAGRVPIPCHKRGTSAAEPGMIAFTLPEIRRLLIKLVLRTVDTAEHVWAWSIRRRRRQYQARLSHDKQRGHPLNRVPLQY